MGPTSGCGNLHGMFAVRRPAPTFLALEADSGKAEGSHQLGELVVRQLLDLADGFNQRQRRPFGVRITALNPVDELPPVSAEICRASRAVIGLDDAESVFVEDVLIFEGNEKFWHGCTLLEIATAEAILSRVDVLASQEQP